MKSTDNPSTPNPTTPIPITEPPENAMFKAFGKLVRAAAAVRTLAFVATFIPIYPARIELNAPRAKDKPTIGWERSLSAVKANKMDTQTINTARTLYSALRKAIAPSAM